MERVYRDDAACEAQLRANAQTSIVHPEFTMLKWHTAEWAVEEIDTLRADLAAQTAEHDKVLGCWQKEIYTLVSKLAPDACIDGGGCDSGDPLDLTLAEIAQGFNHWDNLLFETMEAVSHSYVEKTTFRAASDLIKELHAENEEMAQKTCDECAGDGWVHNRVEGRGACTCMVEAEPFQILLKSLEKIADPDAAWSGIGCAMEAIDALRTVLPLNYAKAAESV